MQERNGIKSKKDKKEKKRDKHERKQEKRREKDRSRTQTLSPRSDRHASPAYDRHSRRRRSLSPRDRSPASPVRYDDRRYGRDRDQPSKTRDRSRSPDLYHRRRKDSLGRDRRGRDDDGRVRVWPRSSDDSDDRERSRSRSPDRNGRYSDYNGKRRRSRSFEAPHSKRTRYSTPAHSRSATTNSSRPSNGANKVNDVAEDRAARLAAMASSASDLTTERQQRLAALRAKEEAALEAEEKSRAKSKGMGGFLSNEQKKVYNGGLEERIRRGRGGMVVDAD